MRGWLYKRVSHPYAPPGLQWRKRYFYVERGELRYDSIKAQRATSGESAGPAFPLRLLRSCDRFGDKFCVTCDETDDAGTPLTASSLTSLLGHEQKHQNGKGGGRRLVDDDDDDAEIEAMI